MNNDEIYMAVAQDKEILEHYGRLGMKWYQHIFGDYQGAAKYADKGAKKLANAKQKDSFNGGGESAKTKKLKNDVKAVQEEAKAAKKRQDEKDADDKKKQEAKAVKAEQKAKADHEQKILDLARGKADWRKASSEELLEAVGRMQIEKQYKQMRDDISGAKVWKDAGSMALKSVGSNMGNIANTVAAPTAKAIAEQWSRNKDFERRKEENSYNDKRKKTAEKNRKASEEKKPETKSPEPETKPQQTTNKQDTTNKTEQKPQQSEKKPEQKQEKSSNKEMEYYLENLGKKKQAEESPTYPHYEAQRSQSKKAAKITADTAQEGRENNLEKQNNLDLYDDKKLKKKEKKKK